MPPSTNQPTETRGQTSSRSQPTRALRRVCMPTTLVASLVFAAPRAAAQETLPYDPEEPVPVGYHVEERPRYHLLITGAALSGVAIGWLVYANGQRAEELRAKDSQEFPSPSTVSYTLAALHGIAALPVLLVGLVSKKVLVADSLKFAPLVSSSFGGLVVGGTF